MEKCGAKVTIITAVYNGAEFLERAIDSIAAQDYPNIEYIVIDGGSTDGTLDILRRRTDVVTRYISEPDKGIYDAMNKGVSLAAGDWIYFLGCDDFLYPAFSDMCRLLKDDHTIYYANVFHRGRAQDGSFDAYKLSKYPIPHQAIIYPRIVFDRYRYDLRYKVSADHYLTIRCWHDKDIRFCYVDMVIARYTEGGFSSRGDALFQREKPRIVRDNLGLLAYLRYRFRLYKYRRKVQWYDKINEGADEGVV